MHGLTKVAPLPAAGRRVMPLVQWEAEGCLRAEWQKIIREAKALGLTVRVGAHHIGITK